MGWDVVDIKNNAKNLMGRIMGINFISGDADKNNAGLEKEEREGECMISFVDTVH